MRLLMAYGRRFTHPRPYKLIDLANAAGMSISGVRIAFDDDEITQAAEILHRQPTAGDGPGRQRHDRPRRLQFAWNEVRTRGPAERVPVVRQAMPPHPRRRPELSPPPAAWRPQRRTAAGLPLPGRTGMASHIRASPPAARRGPATPRPGTRRR